MRIALDFRPPVNPNAITSAQEKRIWEIFDKYPSGHYIERLDIEYRLKQHTKFGLGFIVDTIMYRHQVYVLKGVAEVKELSFKGVEELGKVKNRVARLYGQGRITAEDFNTVHEKILDLETTLKEVKEKDGSE